MKKLILMFAILLMSTSLAWATPTIVDGKVYSGPTTASAPVVGATVDETCDTATPSSDVTDATGEYFVGFETGCDLGDTAQSCVGSICNSAVVNETLAQQINIVGVDIFNVPEFGVLAAVAALAGSGILFFTIRKRK